MKKMLIALFAVFAFASPMLVAQEIEEPPQVEEAAEAEAAEAEEPAPPAGPSALWEFIGLLVNGGLSMALVQFFRRIKLLSLIPAFLRPVLAGGIGIGVSALTAYVLTNFGVELDLSAIVAFFAAGGGASMLFGMGKELGVVKHEG